jgi:hypothetical protein
MTQNKSRKCAMRKFQNSIVTQKVRKENSNRAHFYGAPL